MANIILTKSYQTDATVPAATTLKVGELAVNTHNGRVYLGTDLSGAGSLAAGATATASTWIGGNILDEDNLASDSAIALATQQSIKYYVDNTGGTGDITGVTLATDSGTASDTAGSADFTIAGGAGIDTSSSGTTITITGETAAADNPGIVELATTAETNTGSDAARAVTPDGLNDWTGGAGAITKLGTIASGVWSGTALVAAAIGADAITAAKIGDDVINSEHYAAASIDNEHLADDAVDSAELAAGAVDLAHMSANSVDSPQYVDASIDNAHLAANSVDSDNYVDASIDDAHLSDGVATGLAGAGTTATSGVLNVIGGNGITANANDIAVTAAQTTVTSVINAALTVGRDSTNTIGFGTDNVIISTIDSTERMRVDAAGVDITGNLTVSGNTTVVDILAGAVGNTLEFEGATADGYETTLTVVDPTADRTITLPNVTGTVITTGDSATVTATMLAANSVDSSELVNGSIDVGHMAANSVDSAQYVDGSIDAAHLAADCVTAAKIGDNVLNSEHYAAASIDNEHLADDAVDSAELAAGAVDLAHMSANSVDSPQYVDASIDLAHMSANSVDSPQYVDASIDNAHLAANSVDSDNYVDGSIDNAHIANSTIANAKLANDGITICGVDKSLGGSITAAVIAAAIDSETMELTNTTINGGAYGV